MPTIPAAASGGSAPDTIAVVGPPGSPPPGAPSITGEGQDREGQAAGKGSAWTRFLTSFLNKNAEPPGEKKDDFASATVPVGAALLAMAGGISAAPPFAPPVAGATAGQSDGQLSAAGPVSAAQALPMAIAAAPAASVTPAAGLQWPPNPAPAGGPPAAIGAAPPQGAPATSGTQFLALRESATPASAGQSALFASPPQSAGQRTAAPADARASLSQIATALNATSVSSLPPASGVSESASSPVGLPAGRPAPQTSAIGPAGASTAPDAPDSSFPANAPAAGDALPRPRALGFAPAPQFAAQPAINASTTGAGWAADAKDPAPAAPVFDAIAPAVAPSVAHESVMAASDVREAGAVESPAAPAPMQAPIGAPAALQRPPALSAQESPFAPSTRVDAASGLPIAPALVAPLAQAGSAPAQVAPVAAASAGLAPAVAPELSGAAPAIADPTAPPARFDISASDLKAMFLRQSQTAPASGPALSPAIAASTSLLPSLLSPRGRAVLRASSGAAAGSASDLLDGPHASLSLPPRAGGSSAPAAAPAAPAPGTADSGGAARNAPGTAAPGASPANPGRAEAPAVSGAPFPGQPLHGAAPSARTIVATARDASATLLRSSDAATAASAPQPPAAQPYTLAAGPGAAVARAERGADPAGGASGAQTGGAAAAAAPQIAPDSSQTAPAPALANVADASGAERLAVVHQVAQQIASLHGSGARASSTITVRLSPERWGDMKIAVKIADDESGTTNRMRGVEAVLTTSNPGVRAAILDSRQDLRTALEQNGLRLDKLDVVVSASSTGSTSSGNSSFEGNSHNRSGESFQAGFGFGQGGGSGPHSQASAGGFGQSPGRSAPPPAIRAAAEPSAILEPAESVGPARTDHRVDYRI